MYCPFCGKQIPDDSSFCPECGNDIRDSWEKQPYPPEIPRQPEEDRSSEDHSDCNIDSFGDSCRCDSGHYFLKAFTSR